MIIVDAHLVEPLLMNDQTIRETGPILLRGRSPCRFGHSASARPELKHDISERWDVFAPQIALPAEDVGFEYRGRERGGNGIVAIDICERRESTTIERRFNGGVGNFVII